MARRRKRRIDAEKAPPIDGNAADRRHITAVDSEDEAGTYAPRLSAGDTGENDDGVLARPPEAAPPSRRKEAVR